MPPSPFLRPPRRAGTPAKRIVVAAVAFLCATFALAGGGPENVLLVVNPRSPASLTIANHYVQLRQIPADNLLFLPWDPGAEQTDVDAFRKQILIPVLKAIKDRHLEEQIDYVIYSADFPWGITLGNDTRKFLDELPKPAPPPAPPPKEKPDGKPAEKPPAAKVEWPPQLGGAGSLTGLTYLWQPVVAGQSGYFDFRSNGYMRPPLAEKRPDATIAFRASRQFDREGKVVTAGGRHYFLSTMLGVTAGRGNTLAEVLSYLKRSAAADGTHPKGTIYFVQNGDIRSRVRQGAFPAAVRELKKLGVSAEIVEGTVPLAHNDVQGVVMGIADFNWKASGSTILPGAICEHFTSFGGIMSKGAGQTPLSEFLRYGAAGASGTVTEPYAIANKFPSPMIQVHYVRGCTLAESFFQSVHGPYQLLVVGDPLCRPWAVIPRVTSAGVKPGAVVRGQLEIKPSTARVGQASSLSPAAGQVANLPPPDAAADHFELFVDGLRRAECKPGETLTLDTTELADGSHELRVVAVGPPPIETQGRQIIPVRLANHGRRPPTARLVEKSPHADKPLVLAVRSPGSVGVVVLYDGRTVGRLKGQQGQVTIPANTLGAGPVRLQVVGLGAGGPQSNVFAEPLDITVE